MEEDLIEILRIALRNHVTDIHFSMYKDGAMVVDMRVNGIIRRLKNQKVDQRFFHYLLYRANMDVSNTMEPQTGRFEVRVDDTVLALRFALIHSYALTSGVLRILNNHAPLSIDTLCSEEDQCRWMKQITMHRSGLYLFSGPTGSGKTTTLYTILNETTGKKIYTLEDPVEVFSDQYVQIQINEKQHMSYADGIKQLMRHDPDIIMIGEIRDSTAAEMAVRSALTGHLVVSSIHASTCSNAIERMKELGVLDTQLMDVLCGISTQRLYDVANGKKIGVYEIMDRKEVNYYFENGTHSKDFVSLEERIHQAIEKQVIPEAQAQTDLD